MGNCDDRGTDWDGGIMKTKSIYKYLIIPKSTAATPQIIEVAQQRQLAIDETLLEGCIYVAPKPMSSFEERRGVDI